MLRKRTSFKPNLKQVAPQQTTQTQSSTTTSASQAAQVPKDGPTQPIGPAEPPPAAGKQSELVINDDAQQTNPSTLSSGSNSTNVEHSSIQQPTASTPNNPPTNPKESCNIAEGDANGSTNKQSQPANEIPDMSNQRVQEAITQLTGQKFEPIKSLSLRTSANKNVKLKDLLFFNPPMTKDQKRHKKSVCLAKKKNQDSEKEQPQSQQQQQEQPQQQSQSQTSNGDAAADEMDTSTEEHSLMPKVKMGPDGKLILDESSTIINRKNLIKEQEAIVEDNEDIISKTNYDSFRRRPTNTSQTKWSLEDTKKFYHALTILGTDFSMMESLLFSGLRSRTELHKKFKREERVNKLKIDIALSNRISLNSEELEDLREIFYK